MPLLLAAGLAVGSACAPRQPPLAVFYAAAFEPVLHDLRRPAEDTLRTALASESGGSGNLIRKVTELGRACDLLMLADPGYFKDKGAGRFDWRLDFAGDELVLAIGARAPRPDAVEVDWAPVLLDPAVRLGRTDETISPAGVRTRRLWQREERRGRPGFKRQLLDKTAQVVDDVGTLSARLKSGDLDYAFLYRTTCLMQDIRFVRLAPHLRLAHPDPEAIVYSLSIPRDSARARDAEALIRFLLNTGKPVWLDKGFALFQPVFFGPPETYDRFRNDADYGGPF